ncbi:sensor histidine kinase [Metabacillus halosaccharovorans]|uniref:sensor histidine kinase n=1 Tax=Metabacillus halosaccharovorans TaxID=930124 RepID=UPI001C1F8D29|nr:HAMP domain-containing sensor histidine kinase [Metabacillus halosaccharovorans]MBU7594697.1 HAMP domain-containing histidine kinase [Metabacillus halosaccharovorans]
MLYLFIIVMIAFVYVLTRFCLLKKEIKNTTRQLHDFNLNKTAKKIDINYNDSHFEELAKEINNQIDLTKQAEAVKRSTENELKQAISHISHDIRTPMTSILGYIQFLESDEISPELKKEYIKTIKNSAGRLKILLEDFFELSIIEQADYPLKVERVRLNDLIVGSLFGFYEEFNKRKIEPEIHIPDNDIMMMTDPSAVKRVLENLVVNAIRYSIANVVIRLEKFDASVQLRISNTVDKLNEQDVNQMFDRFYKADQTRTGKGTGLGLPIAKSLMEKMNGSIYAKLEDNQITITCEWRL